MRDLAFLISAIAWPVVAAYAVRRLAAVADTTAHAMLEAKKPVQPEPEIVIPEDLVALAISHTEQWAQDDTYRAIRESYEKWKDWNRVRAAMGIGRLG